MTTRAVFFDAGGTIIHPVPPVGEVYARALHAASIAVAAQDVEREFRAVWRRLRRRNGPGKPAYGATESEAKDWWRLVVHESFKPFGQPVQFEKVFQCLWDHFASPRAWRVYDDVLPTFGGLRRRTMGIGLISNWDVRLHPLLERLGLLRHFQWVVISCEVGAEKPDPAIFQRALQLCAVPPEDVIHVGDDYEDDVCGARRAGLQAIWLDRNGKRAGAGDAPAIASLGELPGLLH